jgi:hypothetical protein
MSADTRQYVEELLALAPWLAFVVAAAWFRVLELRDTSREARAEERVRVQRRPDSPSPT